MGGGDDVGGIFPETQIRQLDSLADRYWWHLHRWKTVLDLFERNAVRRGAAAGYVDVGCGPGATTRRVAEGLTARGLLAPAAPVLGIDSDPRLGPYCAKNGIDYLAADLTSPSARSGGRAFDFFTLLDVIEHLDSPETVLGALKGWLARDALGVITVPAFQGLFSQWDVVAGHRRRYDRESLEAVLRRAGYEVRWQGYLYTFAVPAAILRRFMTRRSRHIRELEFPMMPAWLDKGLRLLGLAERRAMGLYPLPFGTTLAAVVGLRP